MADEASRAAAERAQPAPVALRRDLHQHPELSSREQRTGAVFLLGTRKDARGIDETALPLGIRALATLAWDYLARRAQ